MSSNSKTSFSHLELVPKSGYNHPSKSNFAFNVVEISERAGLKIDVDPQRDDNASPTSF